MRLSSNSSGNAALLALALSAIPAMASPVPQPDNTSDTKPKRQVDDLSELPPEDRCVKKATYELKDEDLGYMVCEDPDVTWGTTEKWSCEECFGLNGYEPVKTGSHGRCNIVVEWSGGLKFEPTACPGDDVPEEDPDGNPSIDTYEGFLDGWCGAAGNSGAFGFPNMLACYSWAFSKGGTTLEQNAAGINLVCDTIFFGMCTAFGGVGS